MKRGCGKVRYRDHIAALHALARLQNQGKQGHDEARAYLCPRCTNWHLTSQPQRTTPRRRPVSS